MASEDASDRFEELCRKLNMDREAQDSAWSSYLRRRETFTLEGDSLHWLACALYVACRQSLVETVSGAQSRGNSVSLTQILRLADLSLLQFFLKIHHWMDMVNIEPQFREKIEKLQRKFEVANVIFKKYDAMFKDMFKPPTEMARPLKGRKHRSRQCSSAELYKFGWTLFVYIKGHFPQVNGDLVNSHHLLLCCMDMLYANAVLHDRQDLLNSEFPPLPNEIKSGETFEPPDEPPCVMEYLCQQYNGIVREAKAVREHYWKPYMKELFEKRILKGEDSDNMSDILEMPHFTGNNKSLSQEYDRFILSQGEFDEHIFLGEDAYLQIGTPSKTMTAPNTPFEARSKVSRNLARHFEKASVLTPPTPLTGRTYLSDKGPQTTPVSSATQAVMRLRSLLQGYGNKPSKNLSEILSWCGEGFGDQLNTLLERLGKKFMENYNQPFDECSSSQLAEDRLLLANRLFFRLMDLVLSSEQKRLQDSFKPCVQALLSKDDFSSSVFACCVEIVLFSYNSNQCFPWIIQVLNIQSYNFYKVIEVIVKEEPGLSRGVVKHLNQIEESILDSMAWKSGSLLFDVLETVDYNVPKYEDVQGTALQSQACASVTSQVSVTPVPALARSAAASQFSSSMVARRQLGLPMSVPTSPAVALPVPPEKGKGMAKQKQSRSLNLFFRKVYHLAYVRMAHLCDRLEISADQIQKTWTCFEHSLVKHTSLMRDHHLDQLIMCAIYVIGKVAHNELQFQKIMEHYRYQPQSRNHVYRSVLLSVRGSGKGKGKSGASEVEAKVSPQRGGDNSTSPSRNTRRSARRQKLSMATAAASQSDTPPVDTGSGDKVISSTSGSQSDEERGDIIKFYNQIYIYRVKDFALQYSSEDSSGLVSPLSPLPVLKHQHQSPKRRVSAHHSLYLSPQQPVAPTSSLTPQTRRLYCFSRSPAKILQEINKVVQDHKPSGSKRSLSFPEAGSPAKRTPTASPLFNNTLRSLSQDREDASNNGSFTS